MSKSWTSSDIRDGKDVTRLLTYKECPIRNCNGSHRVGKLPDGTSLTYYDHGEFPPGMRKHVCKVLKAAGLIMIFAGWLYLVLAI